jgi:ParB-like chromosome segregation protein Spo0J
MPVNRPWRWRDHIRIHPAAELFPLMAPDELQQLADNIKENGFRVVPVFFVDEHGMRLLDGRSRFDAAELAGEISRSGTLQGYLERLAPGTFAAYQPPEDPYELVVSFNIQRRHLTAEQKRELIEKLIKAKPELSDNATAKLAKVSDKTVKRVREKLTAYSDIPNKPERVEASGRKARGRKPGTGNEERAAVLARLRNQDDPREWDVAAALKVWHEAASEEDREAFACGLSDRDLDGLIGVMVEKHWDSGDLAWLYAHGAFDGDDRVAMLPEGVDRNELDQWLRQHCGKGLDEE